MVGSIDNLKEEDRNLFTNIFAVRALRDSRYQNTAYAIAELIDNSIEASAERIELLCIEETKKVKMQFRHFVSEIAILDDGCGMDSRTLLDALKFGGGTRHNSESGIGKYGMGLPTSSMSQGKRVDVWTWQDGIESAFHCSIDADNIEQGDHLVPTPDQDTPLPEIWKRVGSKAIFQNNTGTLVVWSKLDKIQWKKGKTIINHTAREVGRIHRHFIDAQIIEISTKSFLQNNPTDPDYEAIVVTNDPLYLMSQTSTPEPWGHEPMFKQWGEIKNYTSLVEGKEVTISVQYSIVKAEALKTNSFAQYPGSTDYGMHARHNIGVSVVREDREVVLERAFQREGGSQHNPLNRWWGCEIQFRRSCDELFGVDHNKQMVSNFTEAAKTLAQDDRDNQIILDELGLDENIVYEIVGEIRDQIRAIMAELKKMFEQRRSSKQNSNGQLTSGPEGTATKTATDADRSAVESGTENPTSTDRERDQIPSDTRVESLKEFYVNSGLAENDAQEVASRLVNQNLAYQFNPVQLDGFQIFNVRSIQGILHINLNIEHPIYDLLKHIETNLDESDPAFQASVAMRLLLLSWARMEDQTESKQERTHIQDIAMKWGRQVDKMINQLRERED